MPIHTLKLNKQLLLAFLVTLLVWTVASGPLPDAVVSRRSLPAVREQHENLKVHILNVGHGTAVLIESPDKQALLDSGSIFTGERVLEYLRSRGIRAVDYCLVSRPAPEHVGGLLLLVHQLTIHTLVPPPTDSSHWMYRKVFLLIEEYNIRKLEVHRELEIDLGSGVLLTPLGPYDEVFVEGQFSSGDKSLAWMLSFGNVRFLFAADLTTSGERLLLRVIDDLRADVLLVAAHGQKDATSTVFLETVEPRLAVISSGGPQAGLSPQVLSRIEAKEIPLLRTDTMGHVVISSDGVDLNWETQKTR